VFLLIQGDGPRGVIGSGTCASPVFQDDHWNDEHPADEANYVLIDWDTLVLPEDALSRTVLMDQIPSGNGWRPQASGTVLDAGAAAALEQLWARHVHAKVPTAASRTSDRRRDQRRDEKKKKIEKAIFDGRTTQHGEAQDHGTKDKLRQLFRRSPR
jgi:hypothetical protein